MESIHAYWSKPHIEWMNLHAYMKEMPKPTKKTIYWDTSTPRYHHKKSSARRIAFFTEGVEWSFHYPDVHGREDPTVGAI